MIFRIAMIVTFALMAGCSGDSQEAQKRAEAREYYRTTNTIIPASDEIITFPALPMPDDSRPASNPDRNAYFGDLHVHTTLSFDASAFGTTASLIVPSRKLATTSLIKLLNTSLRFARSNRPPSTDLFIL